jgi:hypothetical protein
MNLAKFGKSAPPYPTTLGITLPLSLCYIAWPIYAIYFHSLARYSVPKLWLFSRLPYSQGLRQGSLVYKLRRLHKTYRLVGHYGANELPCTDLRAWKDVYGFYYGEPGRRF